MSIPDKIKIGPMQYDVVEVPRLISANTDGNLANLFGQILYAERRIEIEDEINDLSKAVTLWHEAMHGMLEHAGLGDHSEEMIVALGYGVVQLIQDNPDLLKFTRKALGAKE